MEATMQQTLSLLLFSLLFLFGCGADDTGDRSSVRQEQTASPVAEAGRVTLWSRSGGYDAAVFLPADYGVDPNQKYPLVISLHGFNGSVLNPDHTDVGGDRTGFIKQVWDTPLALTYPGIVIAPDVYVANTNENTLWNHDKLRELIEDSLERYSVDPRRVTVTGHSAGSLAAQELALRSKDLIAGIMPGAFEAAIKLNLCSVADLPLWSFGNTSDVLFQAASWRDVESRMPNCDNFSEQLRLSILENDLGHDGWDEHWSQPEVQDWLVEQRQGLPSLGETI